MHFKNYITLFVLILFSSLIRSQDLQLQIVGFTPEETSIISKYSYPISHTSLESIKKNVALFQNKLLENGYLNHKLVAISKTTDSFYVAQIHLKNKIENIHIYIDSLLNTQSYFSKLNLPEIKNNHIYLPYLNIESQLKNFNTTISVSGYPFSTLKLVDITQKNPSTLSAKLIIDTQDDIRRLDKIIIKGYEKFPKSYLKHYLKIKPNKIFNIESVNKKIINLNNLSFTRQTKSPEILFTRDSTQLYLYLEKMSSNNFDGFIGFATNEVSNKIEFNGYLNLQLVNNLNYGESLYLDYKSDESEQKNFNLIANLPYLFNSPLGLETSLNITKRDSTFITTKQKASLFFQLNPKNTIYAGLQSTASSNLSNTDLITVVDYNSNFYTAKYQFLQRQNEEKLFQIKSQLTAEFGIGKRKTSFGNENQTLIDINASHIFNLNKNNSIYIKGILQIINSENYLENELYRFGGINSIRGFTENSLTANNLYALNTEYRYKLSNTIFLNSIIDFADFKNKILQQNETIYGFGFGFGILTKGGLLRFIYANGKTKATPFNVTNSKIHLSLKTIF